MTELISVAMYSSNDRPHRERERRGQEGSEKSQSQVMSPGSEHHHKHMKTRTKLSTMDDPE